MAGRVLFFLRMFVGIYLMCAINSKANGKRIVKNFHDEKRNLLNDETATSSTPTMVIAQIDLNQYKQEEIDVDIRDMKIYVKGRHVIERENGYDASEFERFYAVPEGVDPWRVSTRYSDGMLKIEAPRPGTAGGEIVSDDEKFEIEMRRVR